MSQIAGLPFGLFLTNIHQDNTFRDSALKQGIGEGTAHISCPNDDRFTREAPTLHRVLLGVCLVRRILILSVSQ